MQLQPKAIEEIVAAIEALDLDPIKFKLMDQKEGQGWSREYVDQMEVAYKRFLTLVIKYPEQSIAPTKDIDTFWHGHILDTMKYAEDCQNVFGFFLHHFPYFGLRGEEDAAKLAEAGKTMDRLYEREFGERIPTAAATVCGAAQPTVCGASVTSVVCGAAQPSVCGAVVESKSTVCGAAKPTVCGAAIGSALNTAVRPTLKAVCGAAKPTVCGAAIESQHTVCGAAGPTVCGATVQTAVCGAAIGAALDVSARPTMKRAA
jgi:hypothetical protein